MIWEIIGIIWVIAWVFCLYEFYRSPVYPADYNEDGINPDYTEIGDDEE
tara:strand:+ start:535 stop:681 length:147 start_codon:yes stop_codon:yes gene_type:complete